MRGYPDWLCGAAWWLTDTLIMTMLLALVVGWCLTAAAVALGLGPLLRHAAELAEAHENPQRYQSKHTAA